MKKLLLLSSVMMLLMTSCEFDFIKLLQPAHVGLNQKVTYPVHICFSGNDVMEGEGSFVVSLPSQMSLDVDSPNLQWLFNDDSVFLSYDGVSENDSIHIYKFSYNLEAGNFKNRNDFIGLLTLNTGDSIGDFSVSYLLNAFGAMALEKELPISTHTAASEDVLTSSEFFTESGLDIEQYYFYVCREHPSASPVSEAYVYLMRSGEQDVIAPLVGHDNGRDFFTAFDGLPAGDYTYKVKMVLEDNTILWLGENSTLSGPEVTEATVYALPYSEDFDGISANAWKRSGVELTWDIGTPTVTNQVGTQAYDGTRCIGTNMTVDGYISIKDTSYITSPIINVQGQDEVVIDYRQLTSILDENGMSSMLSLQVTSDFESWLTVCHLWYNSAATWEMKFIKVDQFLDGDYMQFRWGVENFNGAPSTEGILIDKVRVNTVFDYDFNYVLDEYSPVVPIDSIYYISSYIFNKGKYEDSYVLGVSGQEDYEVFFADAAFNEIAFTPSISPGDSLKVNLAIRVPKASAYSHISCELSVSSQHEPDNKELQLVKVTAKATHGGPDVFGYTWVNELDSSCADFQWIDFKSHQPLYALPLSFWMGFDFDFYGQTIQTFYMSQYGKLYFVSGDENGNYVEIPNSSAPNNFISYLGGNVYVDEGYVGYEENVDGSNAKVVTLLNVQDVSSKDATMDVQIILKDCGDIKIQYRNISSDFNIESAIVGIENSDGSDGLQYQYDEALIHENSVVEFRHPEGGVFSDMMPVDRSEDKSQYEILSWKNPRNTDSISLYIREGDADFTADDLVYYGASIKEYTCDKVAAYKTHFWQVVSHHEGELTMSNIQTFTTKGDAVVLYGEIYAEDSVTLLENVVAKAQVQYQMGTEWFYSVDTTDSNGTFRFELPQGGAYEVSAYLKGYDNYSEFVEHEELDSTNEKQMSLYLQSQPTFISFSFNDSSESVFISDSIIYAYVGYDVDMTTLVADYQLPVAVSSSADLTHSVDYTDTLIVALETSQGESKNWYIIVRQRPDLSRYDRREIEFLHNGEMSWQEKRMDFYISSPNFICDYCEGIGIWPAVFECHPDSAVDKIVYAELLIEEGCGKGCTAVQAIDLDSTIYNLPIFPLSVQSYAMNLIDQPSDTLRMMSFEAMLRKLVVWVDVHSQEPIISAISPPDDQTKLLVYPNPAEMTISVTGLFEPCDYQIISLDGRVEQRGKCVSDIDISELRPGIHLLNLQMDDASRLLKFVKR